MLRYQSVVLINSVTACLRSDAQQPVMPCVHMHAKCLLGHSHAIAAALVRMHITPAIAEALNAAPISAGKLV